MTLLHEQRVRRVAILCCTCMRNIAFYRACWDGHDLRVNNEFWKTVSGNFLDTAVHEWFKAFAHKRSKHHWSKVIPESSHAAFEHDLLAHLDLAPMPTYNGDELEGAHPYEQFNDLLRKYRDKFLAHLDDELVANLPVTEPMRKGAEFLFDYLTTTQPDAFSGYLMQTSADFFDGLSELGRAEVNRREAT